MLQRQASKEFKSNDFACNRWRLPSESPGEIVEMRTLREQCCWGEMPRMSNKPLKLNAARYFLDVRDGFTLASDNEAYGRMIERIRAVACEPVNVMLTGSPGSGKELVAEAIHRLSKKKGMFLKVNCAALPGTLLESELFGHIKGAFTGAHKDRKGSFASANEGTLFLDEICHLDYEQQAKLLRVVEYGEYAPVGADKTVKTNARLIVAVNVDMGRALADKHLRPDLYYRLANYIIQIPDLRERPEDTGRLVDFYFRTVCIPRGITDITPECLAKLVNYSWPGNIRELKAAIESAAINASHRGNKSLTLQDLDEFPSRVANQFADGDDLISKFLRIIYQDNGTLKQAEEEFRRLILGRLLEVEKGNTTRISEVLGITPDAVRTLYSRAGLSLGKAPNHTVCNESQ